MPLARHVARQLGIKQPRASQRLHGTASQVPWHLQSAWHAETWFRSVFKQPRLLGRCMYQGDPQPYHIVHLAIKPLVLQHPLVFLWLPWFADVLTLCLCVSRKACSSLEHIGSSALQPSRPLFLQSVSVACTY